MELKANPSISISSATRHCDDLIQCSRTGLIESFFSTVAQKTCISAFGKNSTEIKHTDISALQPQARLVLILQAYSGLSNGGHVANKIPAGGM